MLDILRRVRSGELSPEAAVRLLAAERIVDLPGVAALDVDRARRTGLPEVVLAGPKRPAQVVAIVDSMLAARGSACVSRMRAGHRAAVATAAARHGAAVVRYGRTSARVVAPGSETPDPGGFVGLLAAGTSDLEPLGEARMVCEAAGCATVTVADVGVAGLHRLFEPLADLLRRDVDALVVAAGMDGALPSVVAGLAGLPVIGLPVSSGYGAGGNGEAALLAMLQTCSPGLTVVNVDNGVGAGAAAALVARRRAAARHGAGEGAATAPAP